MIEIQEAKRIRAQLEEMGIPVSFKSNPETCSSASQGGGGCKPTIEVHFDDADMDRVKEFLQREHRRDLGDAEADPALISQVFDSEKEDATCPACGTQFKTTASECPDCGLSFGVPDGA